MLNHFYFKDFNSQKLVTNDLGRYTFLSNDDFELLMQDNIKYNHPKYFELLDSFFVYDGNKEVFLQRIREEMRVSKIHLFSATSLFIFVVTNRCNSNCVYCQAKDIDSKNCGMMSLETAEKGVDIALQSPSRYINIEFQGGEPLMNFEVIRHIVEYASLKSQSLDKTITYSLVSNLTLLTDEMKQFICDNNINLSTSLDGDKVTHSYNRPLYNQKSSFDLVVKRIKEFHDIDVPIGAIETTTRKTLTKYRELIDTYLDNNLHSIFLRPLTPLGIAKVRWKEIGYTAEEYTDFYRHCINYLIEKNLSGQYISEGHAVIFLRKILLGEGVNYMELRSPCGATIGQMAFYYDGRVFTCDEGRMLAEMGNDSFLLGSVEDTYDDLINTPVCKAACTASILESLPDCSDCAFSPFCGTCPVINLAFDGDIFSKTPRNYRCKVYSGMITVLFEVLQRGNESEINVLKSWVRGDS